MADITGWVGVADVHRALGGPFTPDDATYLALCVDATNAIIHRWHPDWPVPVRRDRPAPFGAVFGDPFDRATGSTIQVDAAVRLGALKLACAFYNRRGAMGADYAQFEGMGGFAVPGVVDAEISALLDINRHHEPLVC